MSFQLPNLTKKNEIDTIIRDTIDKVLVLRFGRSTDPLCLQLDDIVIPISPSIFIKFSIFSYDLSFSQLAKSARQVSKFASVALVDIDSEEVQVYINYFDITLIPSTVFFFNAQHMKMDSGSVLYISLVLVCIIWNKCLSFFIGWWYRTADHTKWIGAFQIKQDFIDVVEVFHLFAWLLLWWYSAQVKIIVMLTCNTCI